MRFFKNNRNQKQSNTTTKQIKQHEFQKGEVWGRDLERSFKTINKKARCKGERQIEKRKRKIEREREIEKEEEKEREKERRWKIQRKEREEEEEETEEKEEEAKKTFTK